MASPSVKQNQPLTNCAAIFQGGLDSNQLRRRQLFQGEQGCGLQNYNRSLLRLSMPLTLTKDARGAPFVSRGRHRRRLELNEHSPRRSNLVPSTQASRGGRFFGVR